MKRELILTTAVAAVLFAAAPALAEEKSTTVSEVVATATRATDGVPAEKIGSSVTVITAQDMEDRQVRVVSDVLRDVPGFAVSRTGAIGGLTQVRVRGTEGNHVLTLIDGIKADDPFQGEFDYGTLVADDVARIEILRGPQSALYGSDALAGVINYIIPTGAQEPGLRFRAEGGSMSTLGLSGRLAGVTNGFDYVLNSSYQTTDGYVGQTLPGGTRKLGSDLVGTSAKLSYTVSDDLKLKGGLRYNSSRADTDGSDPICFCKGQVDSPGSYYEYNSTVGYAGADLKLLDGRWTHSLLLQGTQSERNSFTAFARSSGDKGTRQKASYVTAFRIDQGKLVHSLSGAIDYERETFQNTSPPSAFGADTTKRAIRNTGLVGDYELPIGDNAGVGVAVRHDDNNMFGGATTYKTQGYYRFNDFVRVRAAAGSGIKNPMQTELFGYNASVFPFVGNPNLVPEKSVGWEVGGDFSALGDKLNFKATYFSAVLQNEIVSRSRAQALAQNTTSCPVPPVGFTTTCNAITHSTQDGVELSADLKLFDQLSVNATYTYLDAKEGAVPEIRRAPHIGSANVTWKTADKKGTINLNVRYNGEQTDSNFSGISVSPPPAGLPDVRAGTGVNAGKVVLGAFTLVNLSASYKLREDLEVFARGENLTNAKYYEVFGYPTAPRAAYFGLRVRF